MGTQRLRWITPALVSLGLVGCSDPATGAAGGSGPGVSGVGDVTGGDGTSTGGGSGNAATAGMNADTQGGDDAQTDEGDPGPPITFDVGGGLDDEPGPGTVLSGTVWGPRGDIPVSGALVYTTMIEPTGIPQGVYCAECEALDETANFTVSNADGTFELGTVSAQDVYLVVRKGEFMRVSTIDVDGSGALDDALTTLPGQNDPASGLYIPLIAVGDGAYDRLEDALGKFGLGDTSIANFEERLVPGTEPFDLYDNGQNPATDGFVSAGSINALVSDPALLAQYHIIFLPCSTDGNALTPTNIQNIRDWVALGGRWYVSDWSNEYIRDVFPEYQQFYGGNSSDLGSYDSLADINDAGLLEWLEAIPAGLMDINPLNDEAHPTLFDLPQVQTVDNWSGIQTINPVIVQDDMGNDVDVGHKVWLTGPGGGDIPFLDDVPLTVTGQYGCGKIQFTSYHTAEFFDYVGLSPQELVLLYTILEIGVCQDPLPPPIPEG